MAPQSARRDRKNQCFPPCYSNTLLGDLDPVRELPYGLAAYIIAASAAGQMAASDQVSDQPKNHFRSGGRPQMENGHSSISHGCTVPTRGNLSGHDLARMGRRLSPRRPLGVLIAL